MKNEFCTYLDHSPILFFKWANSEHWPVLHVSENIKEFLGYNAEVFRESKLAYQDIIHPDDLARIEKEMYHHIEALSPSFTHSAYRLKKADNTIIWVEDKTYVNRNLYGEIDYFYGYITDISKLKLAEEERQKYLGSIEESNKELIRTINNLQAYKHVLDETNIVSMSDLDGNITYFNEAFLQTSGYKKEEVMGKPHSILRHQDTPKRVFQSMWETIQNKQIWKGFLKNKRKDGSAFYVNVTIAPLLDENRNIEKYISVRHNITDLIQKSDELKLQAITDPLTQLGNRFKLLLDKDKLSSPCLAIFDIANFNEINDFYGYFIGDKLIQELGENLSRLGNESYGFYRMYADQFVVLGDQVIHENFENTMREWHAHLRQTPLHVGDEEVYVNLMCVLSFEERELLLTTADLTKNHAKMSHLDFCVYHKNIELAKEYERNLYWQKRLKIALENNAIVPFFQPIMNTKTRKIEKYEALVRMVSEDEVVSPFQFLEISKKTNQYSQITQTMIEKSFALFTNSSLKCSINLTVKDIKNRYTMDFLWSALERYKMQGKVILEIVESEGIENFKGMDPFLEYMKHYGCHLSIDDFGTGYSNFNYLIKLQAHTIKIDGSMIKEITNPNSGARDVVEAIIMFAKARGMKTIAEFVSSEAIFEAVCALGIDYAQGYFISPPVPQEQLCLS
ncbi:MAG: EAL domain-containing protein [Campylobacteraceae bacterium]|nr:EAL domain-containing protein [Campylobacteraceae bacterium]